MWSEKIKKQVLCQTKLRFPKGPGVQWPVRGMKKPWLSFPPCLSQAGHGASWLWDLSYSPWGSGLQQAATPLTSLCCICETPRVPRINACHTESARKKRVLLQPDRDQLNVVVFKATMTRCMGVERELTHCELNVQPIWRIFTDSCTEAHQHTVVPHGVFALQPWA